MIDGSNPMDLFRQLIKQIIFNTKIQLKNLVLRLFINEPTAEAAAKLQDYLIFGLLVLIGKSKEALVKEKEKE